LQSAATQCKTVVSKSVMTICHFYLSISSPTRGHSGLQCTLCGLV